MLSPLTLHRWMSGHDRGIGGWAFRAAAWPCQLPYMLAVDWRNRMYDRNAGTVARVTVPVLSVGNITTGGTGKTPFVQWLAKWFRARDLRVSIISRGYGAAAGGRNDEALELENSLPDVPHLQDPDRVAAASIAIGELETQLILLDDGFQHRRIGRDLDIVLLDALQPFGFGHLLPRGLLREPLRGLRRADVIALTRADLVDAARREQIKEDVRRFAPDALWLELAHRPSECRDAFGRSEPLAVLADRKLAAFAAIGHPEAFARTLDRLGLNVVEFRAFPDHHLFTREDVDSLGKWATDIGADTLICTQKDLVKLETRTIGGLSLTGLVVEMAVTAGEADFAERLAVIAARIEG